MRKSHKCKLTMFSIRQEREIANAVQTSLRDTNHPELPDGEIRFYLQAISSPGR